MKKILSRFLQRWFMDTVAMSAAVLVIPGIQADRWAYVILAAMVLVIVNTFVRPVLMLVSLPLIFVTLGLFIFVINALMLLLVDQLIPHFHVSGIWAGLGGALIITITSMAIERITGWGKSQPESPSRRRPRNRRGPPPGSGPVIDV